MKCNFTHYLIIFKIKFDKNLNVNYFKLIYKIIYDKNYQKYLLQ